MADQLRGGPLDHATLAEFLAALGYPLRLELLDQLRFPHTLGEIRVAPHRREGGKPAERTAARQTVQAHLDKLVEANLVTVQPVEQDGREIPQYVANATKLYELTEEIRRLSLRFAGHGVGADHTGTLASATTADQAEGPRLVLVHGVYEGKTFPLATRHGDAGSWIIGRRRDLPIALDYDPFVSVENAVLTEVRGAYTLTDLESKNGTWVNWVQLPRGGSRKLRTGDVVGVGRSLLSFISA